jgi:hypothetical protein
MQTAHHQHEQSPDSLYRMFACHQIREKFGYEINFVAKRIKDSCDDDCDLSKFIDSCNDRETKLFWSLVSDRIKII